MNTRKLFLLSTLGLVILFSFIKTDAQTQRRVWIPTVSNDTVYLYRDKMALIVGVGDYIGGLSPLENAVRDAEEVSDTLRDLGFQVQLLINPTSNELRETLRGLPYTDMGGSSDHALLIYYAGHGYTERLADNTRLGYIIPKDSPSPVKDPIKFASMSISMNEIVELATRLRNNHVLMIFDTCFSGSLFNVMRAIPSPVKEIVILPVRQFITAGTEDEEVPDESVFKKVFLDGISGEADFNKDGFVTGTELGKYLQENVKNYTNGRQTPQFGKIRNPDLDKGEFVFVSSNNKSIMPELPESDSAKIRPNTLKWYIYKDADSTENHGEWTNWMAERDPATMMTLSLVDSGRPYSGRGSSIRATVNFQSSSWGGIAVASNADYWGETPSDIAYNLSGARRLVFRARGKRGGEMIQVKVAIAGDKPYGDSSKTPAATNWIRLTSDWQRYELSLDGYNLRRVITPFAFVTNRVHNERDTIVFYLDDIYFEME